MDANHTILNHVLTHFPPGFTPCSIERPPRAGFSRAEVWMVSCDRGKFCLRCWPAETYPTQRFLGLHRLLRHLAEAGVSQVAVPIAARDDDTLVHMRNRSWQLEPCLPGRADFQERPTDRRLKNAMHTLARWHIAAAEHRAPATDREWFACRTEGAPPGVSERIRKIERWHAPRGNRLARAIERGVAPEFDQLARAIREAFFLIAPRVMHELTSVSSIEVPLQPCLRDLWHDHVLFTGDEVTGLIDPSACRIETVAADLARLLGSLLGDDEARRRFALDEYDRHRPLAPRERRLVPVLDRSSMLLSGMTWLDRVYLRGWNVAHDPRVLERLETILARLALLAS